PAPRPPRSTPFPYTTLFRSQQERPCRRSVATGPPRLLVVGLEGGRHARMHHRSHVGLVDPHSERIGGDDHPDVVAEEPPLHRGPDRKSTRLNSSHQIISYAV